MKWVKEMQKRKLTDEKYAKDAKTNPGFLHKFGKID